ncbi:hypothetical protein D3C87_1551550 [compost metagenome]
MKFAILIFIAEIFERFRFLFAVFVNDPVACHTVQPAAHLFDRLNLRHGAQLVPYVLQNILRILVGIDALPDEPQQLLAIGCDGLDDIWLFLRQTDF